MVEDARQAGYANPEAVGISCAGPLDLVNGMLDNPTNLRGEDGQIWGKVRLTSYLSDVLHLDVYLDNDAACGLDGEMWVGEGVGFEDVFLGALGTGYGTAVAVNKQVVRAGRMRHTEGGHFPIDFMNEVKCGCGLTGCAESWVSGKGFASQFNAKYGGNHTPGQIGEMADRYDSRALVHFALMGRALAASIFGFTVIFSPQVAIITGGFADGAHKHFWASFMHNLDLKFCGQWKGLQPLIRRSTFENPALYGAARLALRKKGILV